jgi:hypothetical protein
MSQNEREQLSELFIKITDAQNKRLDSMENKIHEMSLQLEPVSQFMQNVTWGKKVVIGLLAIPIMIASTWAAVISIVSHFK